jgi:hypothetical protein
MHDVDTAILALLKWTAPSSVPSCHEIVCRRRAGSNKDSAFSTSHVPELTTVTERGFRQTTAEPAAPPAATLESSFCCYCLCPSRTTSWLTLFAGWYMLGISQDLSVGAMSANIRCRG